MTEVRPQPGPQSDFLSSVADICIYGGSAGSGKTFAALLEPLRNHDTKGFTCVLFRRTSPELTGGGSAWEEARAIYPHTGAVMRESPSLDVRWPSGAMMQFMHLQRRDDVESHQSKQYCLIIFEELTHFDEYQFWYMVSRMRSVCGVSPYCRATTNPDPDSFVRKLVAWWIGDQECPECGAGTCTKEEHGTPNPERSGVLRWFIRDGDCLIWGDTKEELQSRYPGKDSSGNPLFIPMSLTFVSAKLDDNKKLLAVDPSYRAKLMALPEVERKRLLGGNWNVRPEAGKYIKQEYFSKRWSKVPEYLAIYSASDYAVSMPRPGHDPDFTEHGIFGIDPNDDIYVLDWWSGQTTSDLWVESLLDKVARWKPYCSFGEAGVIQKAVEPFLIKRMTERKIYVRTEWLSTSTTGESNYAQGYDDPSKRAKARRGLAFQARAAMGKIIFPANAEWSDRVISQCVGFPNGKDDAFDVMGHMCRAIDQAHPAILPVGKKPEPARDYRGERKEKGSWKTS